MKLFEVCDSIKYNKYFCISCISTNKILVTSFKNDGIHIENWDNLCKNTQDSVCEEYPKDDFIKVDDKLAERFGYFN